MARVSYVEPQNAPPEVKEIYDKVLKGKVGNIQKAMAHQPQLLKTFLPFYGSIGKSLGQRLYELIYIRVSMVNGCNY
jgi:alkylhydroperoxidase family enzyme